MTHPGTSSRKALKETLAVYSFDLVGLLAGFLVAYQLGVFRIAPWAIALYPALLGAKSIIDGLLSSRLSTALHLGTIYPQFLGNTKSFTRLVEAVVFLTFAMSVALSAGAMVLCQLFLSIDFIDFPSIFTVVAATMSLGLVLVLVTVKMAFISFKRGLDPDTLVYPLLGTISSIFITLFYILVLNLFFNFGPFGIITVVSMGLVNVVLWAVTLPTRLQDPEFTATVHDSLAALVSVGLIVNLAGVLLKGVDDVLIGNVTLFTGAITGAMFTVYPSIVGFIGDAGSAVGSSAVTKLALGMLQPKPSSLVHNAKSILSQWLISAAMFFLAGVLGLLMNGDFRLSNLPMFLIILLITNVIAAFLTVLLFQALAILIFQKQLDLGNFVTPIENAFVAGTTSVALLVAVVVLAYIG